MKTDMCCTWGGEGVRAEGGSCAPKSRSGFENDVSLPMTDLHKGLSDRYFYTIGWYYKRNIFTVRSLAVLLMCQGRPLERRYSVLNSADR